MREALVESLMAGGIGESAGPSTSRTRGASRLGVLLGNLGRIVLLAAPACLAASCSSPHRVAHEPPAKPVACRLCYDEAVEATRVAGTPRFRRNEKVTVLKHRCPDCAGDVEIYPVDDRPTIRCTACVPEGIPCDKCLPPEGR